MADRDASHRLAPGELEVIRRFVNTHARGGEPDVFADAGTARQWFADLLRPRVAVDDLALARLRELREALRLTLLSHAGHASRRDAVAALEPICARSNLRLVIQPDARPDVTGTGSGVEGFVNDVLATVAMAAMDGSWERLRACGDADCRQAFWDASRNRVGRYCSTTGCANRARQRVYQARHQLGRQPPLP